MFEKLFGRPAKNDRTEIGIEEAIAALLVEAAREDRAYTEEERRFIDRFLASRFALDETAARALREKAEAIQTSANDIHRFTKLAKDTNAADKRALIEALWRIALSDGEKSPHEDAFVRRVCGLIYVDDRESGAIRIGVEQSLGLR